MPSFSRSLEQSLHRALALAILVDGGWALLAARARRFLATRGRLRNRLSGGLMIGAGVGLALARKS